MKRHDGSDLLRLVTESTSPHVMTDRHRGSCGDERGKLTCSATKIDIYAMRRIIDVVEVQHFGIIILM